MPSPVFVGGTGRSGTTVVSRLIGQYPRHHHIDIEVKVHCVPGGLVDVVEGRADPELFVKRVRDDWYWRGWDGGGRGLHWLYPGRHVHRALERFEERAGQDLDEAGRLLMHDLLDPTLPIDRDAWVEMSPPNAMVMPRLAHWFPLAQFVHAVRDGRDVVGSVLRQPWGASTWDEGLAWWAQGMRTAHAGTQAIGQDKVLVVHLEDLVDAERGEDVQTELVEFLGVRESEGVRNFRRHRITSDRANIDRWAQDLDEAERERIDAAYARLLDELAAEGVTCLPRRR